jgi:uncharacterized membrane protein
MFSDGVMAIAITLLILPLTEIEPARGASVATVAIENLGALIGFAVSFAVIANYWSIHHAIFRPVRHHNSWLVLLNLLWLAAIVFLPFPTSLIEGGLDGGFATLYISNLLVISVLNLLIANYLVHHSEITDGESAAESRSTHHRKCVQHWRTGDRRGDFAPLGSGRHVGAVPALSRADDR